MSSNREGFKLFAYLSISTLQSLTLWVLILVPEFLSHHGWRTQKIGWAMGMFFLIYLFSQIFSGHLADRIGNVPTALIGTGVALLGSVFYWIALWWPNAIFSARILHGAGSAMVSSGALFHLVRAVPQELKGRVMGYFGLPGFVMMGIGPLIAETLRDSWGMAGPFTLIIVNFIGVGFILRYLPRPLSPKGSRRETFQQIFKKNFPKLKPVVFFSFVFGFSFSSWHSFLAPTVNWIGVGAISNFGGGYGAGAFLTRLGISTRIDTGKKRMIAISSLILYGVGLALIPHAIYSWQLGLIGLFCGMSHGVYYPALSSIAAERFHPLHTGSAMSLYLSASSLGMFLGPPLWGFVGDQSGYVWVFRAAGFFLICSTVAFLMSRSWSPARRLLWQ